MKFARLAFAALSLWVVTGCANVAHHKFAQPSAEWRSRIGQMRYQDRKITLIGDVLVRSNESGSFELTFTKGPGLPLILVQQDPDFFRVSGPLARGSWSGKPSTAPQRFRGWLALRDEVMNAPAGKTIKKTVGTETFVLRF